MKLNNKKFVISTGIRVFLLFLLGSFIGINFSFGKTEPSYLLNEFNPTKISIQNKENGFSKHIFYSSPEFVFEAEKSEETEFEFSKVFNSSSYLNRPLRNYIINCISYNYKQINEIHLAVPIYILLHSLKLHCV